MNDKAIIGILAIVVIILIVGVIVVSPLMTKEDCKLTVKDKTIYKGDSFVVKLTDMDGNPITNQTVNIKLTDNDDITINEDVSTNSNGNAKLEVEEKGKYSYECSFNGNEKFAENSTSGKITVKKLQTKTVSEETTTSTSMYDSNGFMYPEYGPDYDSVGTSREEAMAGDYRYLEDEIDGKTVGVYTPYDPNAGTYHW